MEIGFGDRSSLTGKQPEAVAGSSAIALCCGHPLHSAVSCWVLLVVLLVVLPCCIQGGCRAGLRAGLRPAAPPCSCLCDFSQLPLCYSLLPGSFCQTHSNMAVLGLAAGLGGGSVQPAAFLWSSHQGRKCRWAMACLVMARFSICSCPFYRASF